MPDKEIFYTLGEDKKIDKLFKNYRKKIVFYLRLLDELKEASSKADDVFTELRISVEKAKKIKLPDKVMHHNSSGILCSVE